MIISVAMINRYAHGKKVFYILGENILTGNKGREPWPIKRNHHIQVIFSFAQMTGAGKENRVLIIIVS